MSNHHLNVSITTGIEKLNVNVVDPQVFNQKQLSLFGDVAIINLEYHNTDKNYYYGVHIPTPMAVRKLVTPGFSVHEHSEFLEGCMYHPELEERVWDLYRRVVASAFQGAPLDLGPKVLNTNGKGLATVLAETPQRVEFMGRFFKEEGPDLKYEIKIKFNLQVPDVNSGWYDKYLSTAEANNLPVEVTPGEAMISQDAIRCAGYIAFRFNASHLRIVHQALVDQELSLGTFLAIPGVTPGCSGQGAKWLAFISNSADKKIILKADIGSAQIAAQKEPGYEGDYYVTPYNYSVVQMLVEELQIAMDIANDPLAKNIETILRDNGDDLESYPEIPEPLSARKAREAEGDIDNQTVEWATPPHSKANTVQWRTTTNTTRTGTDDGYMWAP